MLENLGLIIGIVLGVFLGIILYLIIRKKYQYDSIALLILASIDFGAIFGFIGACIDSVITITVTV